jgi:hypothetical protein
MIELPTHGIGVRSGKRERVSGVRGSLSLRTVMAFLLLVAVVLPLAARSGEDPLWNKAVALYDDTEDWQPRLISIRSEEYDGRGNLKHEETTVTRQYVSENGSLETELVSVVRDGEDITEERRENPQAGRSFGPPGGAQDGDDGDDEESGEAFAALFESIFDPAQQEYVSHRRTGRRRRVDGEPAVAYSYSHEPNEEARGEGTAWLHADSGEPLLVESTLDPPIVFVKDFGMVYRYGTRNGDWRLRSMEFNVSAGVLMFTREFDVTMEFEDYFHAPNAEIAEESTRDR